MEGETNDGHRKPAIGPVPVAAAARRPLLWRGLLLVGLVLIVGSGFRLAEPALDAVRGGSGTDVVADLPDVPPPPPPAPAGPTTGLPPVLVEQPVIVINDPARLRIRRIGIDAPITHLGLSPDGSIAVPKAWGDVGWFDRGPAPGGIGPAVLVGHYDSTTGPAVFYRLPQLVPGDRIEVAGRTGAAQAFIVDRKEDVSKAAFPSQRVYGPVTRPELRLITCGGAFDHKTKHYLNNVVVYAHADTFAGPAPGAPAVPPAQAAVPPARAAAVPPSTVPPSTVRAGTLVPPGASSGAAPPAAGVPVPTGTRGAVPAAPAVPAAGVGVGQGIP
ncbi:sortase family enzyme [Frankia torreyi]|uniref:Sortase family enzyme n=1 Tax=Frankia torreyi TaxID=1856 RepID=A0A0D8BKV5_9ACTN|nr:MULTISPECIES: class F sortase [Frankia]KJE24888.1 sortase family enzyme [Frankia torreyi]